MIRIRSKIMINDKRTQRVLEYDKIICMLADLAVTDYGRDICIKLYPSSNILEVKDLQKQTDDAVKLYFDKSNPPLSGFTDITKLEKYLRFEKSI